MMKRLIALLLCFILAFSVIGCGGPAASGEPATSAQAAVGGGSEPADEGDDDDYYLIGSILPLTGWEQWYGETTKAMYEIVVDYVNENGGIKSMGGKKLKIIFEDHASDNETAISAFERLVEVEGVDAIWGPYATAQAEATQPLADKHEIPYMIIYAYGDPIMATETEWAWRPTGTDASSLDSQYEKFTWMGENMEGLEFGEKTCLMIYGAEDWGASVYEFYRDNPEVGGNKTVHGEAIQSGSADLSVQMNRVRQLEDVDYISAVLGVTDTLLFLRQMKENDIDLPLFGTAGFNTPTFFEEAGDIAQYTFCENNFFHSMIDKSFNVELAKEIDRRFTEKKGHEMDECAAANWMGAMAFVDALERAGTDDKYAINKAIGETNITLEEENLAFLFMQQKSIQYGEIEYSGGTLYNQCLNTTGAVAQAIDGGWRVIWPEELSDSEEYPMVWPVPKWSER